MIAARREVLVGAAVWAGTSIVTFIALRVLFSGQAIDGDMIAKALASGAIGASVWLAWGWCRTSGEAHD